ncbi:glycosyltransferase family 2 protein [Qipengyuania sp. DY56-A-20]|uniref:Glycosyltransferase family 2 protein n=1 Tax=Qipengyuania benthica TaxID=3067651 RepID=A0ABT9H3W1_9SPHN|nr:glycosyltransferase family 2 protein [Qipengyuania sp. DY56-A-20]MDP4538008.1 glycosyltransferase family 2 protein [Qipengyuania sp. DY56-A-20]
MSDRLVSIITPAYRAERVITETIQSVQAQTYSNWEMLICEDCGPDQTRDVVRELARKDDRIILIGAPHNGGPAEARNQALSVAKGRWLAFLDSDDVWLPDKLESQLAFHGAHPEAVISFTGFRRISADGSKTGAYISVPPKMGYRKLLGNTAIATSTVIVDSEISGSFRMKKTYYDDFACWLELLKDGGVAVGLDKDLMRYRVMSASVSRDKKKSASEVWKAFRQVEGLNPALSAWYFAQYAVRAWLKYRRF